MFSFKISHFRNIIISRNNIMVRNMKDNYRKDLMCILALIISFFIVYLFLTRGIYIFGSSRDWNQQHWVIPEYFRFLFYKTHDLFPDFAFNLGAGQNIYNLSYYGLLSPVILVSYLFPFISMREYIVISTIGSLLISVILMYFFIKKKTNSNIALVCSFAFLMSAPLIFHAHRHIMFMNYFPFILLGYMGVDKYFEKNNLVLLSVASFLLIMTNYFFSVCGLLSIVLYGIYSYIKINKKITVKSFICDGLKFLFPILVGVMMSCILIGPTFYSIINGRETTHTINIFSLLIPDFNIGNILYSAYSLGLPAIGFFALVYGLFSKKREDIFLSLVLWTIIIFPIFRYLLNGFLYVEAKILIPLIPLCIILVGDTLKEMEIKNINVKLIGIICVALCCFSLANHWFGLIAALILELSITLLCVSLFNTKKDYKYFYFILFPVLIICSICFSISDQLIERQRNNDDGRILQNILKNDQSFYRINITNDSLENVNRIYDIDQYSTSIYSSSESMNFEDFYYNRIGNEIVYRTYRIMNDTRNIFYNIYLGNKYVISNKYNSGLYEKIDEKIYRNDKVFSIGYATKNIMSKSYYESLSYPDNLYAYLNYTIIDDDDIINEMDSVFNRINLNYDIVSSDVINKKAGNEYVIDVPKSGKAIDVRVNNDLHNKVLLINFDMNYQENCRIGDTYITINGVKNKLSCQGWKYENRNHNFTYVLSDADLSHLKIKFSKGHFEISDISFYTIDYSDIYSIVDNVDQFVINREKTLGDEIYGSIDVTNDGYFNLSIPYDRGFEIYVDGKKTDYERADIDFIGFKINRGHHDIKIEYKAPLKGISIVITIVGIVLLLGEVFMVGIVSGVGNLLNEMRHPKTKLFKFVMGMYEKYKEIFNYLVVGVLTTVVSLVVKWGLLFTIFDAENAFELQVAIIISWIISVLFAYFANRIFVFYSKNKNILKEMIKFFGARVITLVMEMGIMWFFVTLLKLNTDTWVFIWTIVAQVLVIILNYVFSKILVFKKK